MFQVKVCGITDQHQALALRALGVSFLGFIFYPPSPRFVRELDFIARITSVQKVGVFVNASIETILSIAKQAMLTHIQLHGFESPELCEAIRFKGYEVIKTISVGMDTRIQECVSLYEKSVDYFLFDTKHPSHGGTGVHFDWRQLHHVHTDVPVLMSGGISISDVSELTKFVQLHTNLRIEGVDINSRFEVAPGVKDLVLISHFMNQLVCA